MPDEQLTLKYRTLDQHVIYRGKTIEPYTRVNVPEEDEAIWEELVSLNVAERDEEDAIEEEAKLAEPPPPEEDEHPPTAKKKKSS